MLKKLISTMLAAVLVLGSADVSAFTFPEPDWDALLKEKKNMVTENNFELYVEASTDTAPYFGARLEPRSGAYLGMVAENSDGFNPIGAYLTFIDDMNQADLYYPANEMIRNNDVTAMIGWTINDLDNINYGHIRNVLNTLNSYNKQMYIRFANEMNVSQLGHDPEKYITVFRKVADMIHEYPNFAVVWSPNDLGALDKSFEYFYPGDEYVDWIGVSCYSIRYFQGNKNTDYKNSVYFMTGDYAWATNRIKPIINFMTKYNIKKPIMVSEGGVATNNVHGDILDEWAAPRLRNMLWYLVMKYPQIKMIGYFNTHRAYEVERFDVSDYPYAREIFNEAAQSGAYIETAGGSPEFVFQPAFSAGTLMSEGGFVSLYTLVHIVDAPKVSVSYYIDGEWYHSVSQIPYICNMELSGLSDGHHVLTISASGESKTYDFYKAGQAIRFGAEPEVITVTLNGERIEFDVLPVVKNGRTLVPLRKIFEELKAEVTWLEETQTIIAQRNDRNISLQIGSNIMTINGAEYVLDVPARLSGGRTLVPVRAISEAFMCSVDWDEQSHTVIIKE